MWGCDHAQVAAYLINMLGFKKEVFELGQVIRKVGRPNIAISEPLQVWKSAFIIMDYLKAGICPPPEPGHTERLQITSPVAIEGLNKRCAQIIESGSTFTWMLKKSSDDIE